MESLTEEDVGPPTVKHGSILEVKKSCKEFSKLMVLNDQPKKSAGRRREKRIFEVQYTTQWIYRLGLIDITGRDDVHCSLKEGRFLQIPQRMKRLKGGT